MQQDNKQKEEFSREKQNLEIVDQNNLNAKKQLEVYQSGAMQKSKKNFFIGTLNVFVEPLKNRHEKHYKDSNFHLAADLAFVSIILGLAFFLIWVIFFKPINLEIVLESKHVSQQVVSGAVDTFELNYDNKSGENLYKSSLTVKLPDSFIIEKVVPEKAFDYNTNTFYLGDLANGANGKIKITGLVIGAVGDQDEITFIMNYFNKNNKQLSTLNALKYNIENTVLDVKLELPEFVYENVKFLGKIIVKNKGLNKLENIIISYPHSNWGMEKSFCSLNDISDTSEAWTIKELAAGDEVLIEFTSKTEKQPGDYPMNFATEIKAGETAYPQNKINRNISIQKLDVNSSLTTNSLTISDGEKIEYNLAYNNSSSEALKDINFFLSSKDDDFVLSEIEFKGNSDVCQTDGKIIKISELGAGQSGNIVFLADLKRKAVKTNQTAGIKVEVNYVIRNQAVKYEIISEATKILSNMKVKTAGYYFSEQGDQLGVGPMPPIVGIPTNYWIIMEIDNYGNDIKDFVLTAELSNNIVWTGNKSLLSGNLKHGEVGGRIVWEVDKILKEDGKYKAGFEISLIPNTKDVGKTIDLVKDISFNAYDEFGQIVLRGGNTTINTNLESDKLSIGKDKVQAE